MKIPPMRDSEDTLTECRPLEIVSGEGLDDLGESYGVTRIHEEPDSFYRDRVRSALMVSRAVRKADRGESLVPEQLVRVTWVVEYMESMGSTFGSAVRKEFGTYEDARAHAEKVSPSPSYSARIVREERLP